MEEEAVLDVRTKYTPYGVYSGMSDGRRFLGGAAVGLFLAVAIVTAINLGTTSIGPASQTIEMKSVTASSTTATSETASSSGGVAATNPQFSANVSTSTTTALSSSSDAPPIQADNSRTSVSTGAGFSIASLLQTLPAIAIALVLGVVVYQFSIRRVETD